MTVRAVVNEDLLSQFEPNLLSHRIALHDCQQQQLIRVNAYSLATKCRVFYQRYAEEERAAGEPLRLTPEAAGCPEWLSIVLYFCHFDCLRDMGIHLLRDSLLAAAHFGCKKLEEYASGFATAQLSIETANAIWTQLCGLPHCPVTELVRTFVLRHFLALAELETFRDFSVDTLEDLLRDDNLNVWNEDQLVEPLLRWLRDRPATPLLWDQMRLLSSLRFDELTPHARDALSHLEGFHFFEGFRRSPMFSGMCHQATEPRRSHEGVLVLGSCWEGQVINEMFYLDPRAGRLALLAPRFRLPESRFGCACAALGDNRVMVVGGRKTRNHKYTAECLCLDLSNAEPTWQPVAALHEARSDLSAVVCNSILYVIGGEDTTGLLATVESLETSPMTGSAQWRLRAPLPEGRSSVGAASVCGCILACGGYRVVPEQRCQQVDWYDPAVDQWTRLASMTHARVSPGLLELAGRNPQVLVLGGNSQAVPERLQFYASGRRPRWVTAEPASLAVQFAETASCLVDSRWLLAEKPLRRDSVLLSSPISIPTQQLLEDGKTGLPPPVSQQFEPFNCLRGLGFGALITVGGQRNIDRLLDLAVWL